MQFALIILLIIVLLLIIMFLPPQKTRREMRQEILEYESPALRDIVVSRELFPTIHTRNDDAASADDLFTRALLLMREKDDLEDLLHSAMQKSGRAPNSISQSLALTDKTMRALMTRAVAKRARENHARRDEARPMFHDGIIEQRAMEVGAIAQTTPPITRAPPQAIASHEWATDLQNVHDTTFGAEINKRLAQLRASDGHILAANECIGIILFAMKDLDVNAEDKQKVLATLEVAKANNYCARYEINEWDALRLILERSMKFPEHETNIKRALIDALIDCSQNGQPVCLIGRISRYISSLSAIDPEFMEGPRNTEAYRAHIFAKLGQLQAKGGEIGEKEIDEIMSAHRDLPDLVFKKIRDECIAAIA